MIVNGYMHNALAHLMHLSVLISHSKYNIGVVLLQQMILTMTGKLISMSLEPN